MIRCRRASKAILAAAVVAACGLAACARLGDGRAGRELLVIGHRGAPYDAPENTIASFDLALALGATAIETDLCVTGDGRIALWHDPDPDDPVAILRQLGFEWLLYVPSVPAVGSPWRRPVSALALDELRDHYGYAPPFGERDPAAWIPALEDLFAWAAGVSAGDLRALFLDVKLGPGETEAAAFVAAEAHRLATRGPGRLPREVAVYLLSPHADVAAALDRERARFRDTPLRVARDFESDGALEATSASALRDVSTGFTPSRTWAGYVGEVAGLVEARDGGALDSVVVWTLDDPAEWEVLLSWRVDGIMTNDPAALAALRR